MKNNRLFVIFALLTLAGLIGDAGFHGLLTAEEKKPDTNIKIVDKSSSPKKAERDSKWGVSLSGKPGLPNLFKINDNIYRGAQPQVEGFKQLKQMGVKTIINLRSKHTDKDLLKEAGVEFNYVEIRFVTSQPKDEQVREFLKAVTNKDNYPIFIHCKHGSDRTGMMCAVYRMAVDGWTNDQAYKEMVKGGYGFHKMWMDIKTYVKNFDPKKFNQTPAKAAA